MFRDLGSGTGLRVQPMECEGWTRRPGFQRPGPGFRAGVLGPGLKFQCLGSRVPGLRTQCLGPRVPGSQASGPSPGSRGSGVSVWVPGFRASGQGSGVPGLRVRGPGCRVRRRTYVVEERAHVGRDQQHRGARGGCLPRHRGLGRGGRSSGPTGRGLRGPRRQLRRGQTPGRIAGSAGRAGPGQGPAALALALRSPTPVALRPRSARPARSH